jgi:hypothetical protein
VVSATGDTAFIVTDLIYCPAAAHAVPARPFGKAKTKSTTDGRSVVRSVSHSVSPEAPGPM